MQNLHDDKNLDRLSRDAAENFQPDPTLHSWDQVKPGLDKELPEKKEKKRRLIFILFFFLLVGGGIFSSALWLNSNRQEAQQQAPTTDEGNTTSGTTPTSGNDQNNNKQLPVEPGATSTTTATTPVTQPQTDVITATGQQPVNNSRINQPDRIDVRVNAGRKNQTTRRDHPVLTAGTKQDVTKTVTRDATNDVVKDAIKDNTKDVIKDQPDALAKENKTDAVKEQPAVTDEKIVMDDKVVADNKTTPPKDQPSVTDNKQSTAKGKATNQSRNPSVAASRWEFGAVYAPDISTVKFTHTQKPGTNLGLTIGYNISRRFSVQTGAIYTIKNYKSRGEDYHPPKGYWTDYVKLETVAADCDMWDIPINLRYNLVPKRSSNLFVTSGLSSYLMRSEDYNFFYYYNNNPVNRYREYETKSKHWFAVLNLSVGYERQINKSFSVQAEPFFKQPLKGVGFGNVKLNSTGIYFSVKYKPVSKSR